MYNKGNLILYNFSSYELSQNPNSFRENKEKLIENTYRSI